MPRLSTPRYDTTIESRISKVECGGDSTETDMNIAKKADAIIALQR